MKKLLKQKTFWLAAGALALIGGMSLHSTMAYFTTYVTAKGGYPVTLGTTASVEENVENMTKHIKISNTGKGDCYVRVKVFSGSQLTIEYVSASDADGTALWKQEESDGYWYYRDILPVGGQTEELEAKIEVPKEFKESFDIIVIQECTPVLYKEDGSPYADWSRKIDTKTDIGTAEGEGA